MVSAVKDMGKYIREGLQDPRKCEQVLGDFEKTFKSIGMCPAGARAMAGNVVRALTFQINSLPKAELEIYDMLSKAFFSPEDKTTITRKIAQMLTNRARTITEQVAPHLEPLNGHPTLDFGAGDGQVTQELYFKGHNIVGVDVKPYPQSQTLNVPILPFDGIRTSFNRSSFKQAVVTNVLHHAEENEACIRELSRVVTKRLVVIETVPEGKTLEEAEADRFRTFMNDYFYNRLLHDPRIDVPVPGTYETAEGWKQRFAPYGWRCKHEENLGYDIPVIADRHHLLVFDR